jgi:hypothetical protein
MHAPIFIGRHATRTRKQLPPAMFRIAEAQKPSISTEWFASRLCALGTAGEFQGRRE